MRPKPIPLSPTEYLDREQKSTVKHEYLNGEICAMSGATRRHDLITASLVRHAGNRAAVRGGCQVFGSDMKVYVETHNSFYYPDLSVCCDPDDRNELFLSRPCFILEVTLPSTMGIDRREKRASYTSIESLREYVNVDQDRMRVELYRREEGGWRGYLLDQPNDAVESSCLELRLTLSEIYEGVELPPPGVAEPQDTEHLEA